jgi:beta-galactosidase/beta-glucuronidase
MAAVVAMQFAYVPRDIAFQMSVRKQNGILAASHEAGVAFLNGDRYKDYARVFDDWHERDLRAMVRRDRNHPSVVIWSIGNEVIEQWFSDGWQLAQRLAGIVREEDRTRHRQAQSPGTTAISSAATTAARVVRSPRVVAP